MRIISFVLSLSILASLSGCQTTGTAGATTQPALTLPQQVQAYADSLTAAETGVTLAIQLKAISPATYWASIDPIFTAGNSALASLQTAANAGDTAGFATYSTAVMSAVSKLTPFLVQAKSAPAK